MVDRAVLNSVRDYLNRLSRKGLDISFGVVFGSQTTGEADYWSDIDVVVVSPQFDGEITRESINNLWRVAARTDSRIEPIPCGERQWKEDTTNVIIEIARKKGHLIQTT
jgi:predicted nucleotidyltransferase